jgi:hypothetical protein
MIRDWTFSPSKIGKKARMSSHSPIQYHIGFLASKIIKGGKGICDVTKVTQ